MQTPRGIQELTVKIFGDGAGHDDILEMADKPFIKGFTTNPTLMRQAGISDYSVFAREILEKIQEKPISFEVFSDEFLEMERQARIIHGWGANVYVKIPVTNTRGESAAPLIRKLSSEGMQLNVTAILTVEQVQTVAEALNPEVAAIVSVFAGRIADTGRDPMPIMREAKATLQNLPHTELLWASCRETFNIYQADEVGADIITVPYSILHKLDAIGTDLTEYSLESVKTFYEAGRASGFTL